MIIWAAIIALIAGTLASIGDWSSALVSMAELIGVMALFAIVCAAEAFSVPRD